MPHVEPTTPWPSPSTGSNQIDWSSRTLRDGRGRVSIDWSNPDSTDLWEAIRSFVGVPTLADLMQDTELVDTVKAALEEDAANPVVKHPDIGPGEET